MSTDQPTVPDDERTEPESAHEANDRRPELSYPGDSDRLSRDPGNSGP